MKWFTRKDVCEILDISMPTLSRLMASGKITYYKNSESKTAKTKFKYEDIMKYLEATKYN